MASRIKEKLEWMANPIMIKAMYQSVHSRLYLAAFWILLCCGLAIYFFVYLSAEYNFGQFMFAGFSFLLAFVTLTLLPASSFFSLYNEVTSRTLELVQVTGMNSKTLVRGHLLAAGARIVLLFSMIAPFAVASYLFGGIDLLWVLGTLWTFIFMSFCFSAVGICFASLGAYERIRTLVKWGFLGLLALWVLSLTIGALPGFFWLYYSPFGVSPESVETPALVSSLVLMALFSLLAVLFLTAIAANALTFPHNRSSVRTKWMALGVVAALFCFNFLLSLFPGGFEIARDLSLFLPYPYIFFALCGLVWITADQHIPQRHLEKLNRHGILARILYFPFRDGASSTVVYLFLGVGILLGGTFLLWALHSARGKVLFKSYNDALCPAGMLFTYVLFLSAFADGATRFFPKRFRTPASRRIVLFLILLGNSFVPLAFLTAEIPMKCGTGSAFLPFLYFGGLVRKMPSSGAFLGHMALPFFVGFLWHAGAGLRGKILSSRSKKAKRRARV